MNTYKIILFRPGGVTFDKRNDPHALEPEVQEFGANSPTEALNLALDAYKKTGLGVHGHFNVELAYGAV